jgi:signal transduction histidine kinase
VRWQNELLGVLEATHTNDDAFSADDVGMLEAVANWLAIAIGKVSQHQALQRRLQESEAIADLSRALSQTLEPQTILEMIVQIAHDLVPRSEWAVIHLLMGRPEMLEPAAVAGTDLDLREYKIQPDEGLAGLALREGKVINVGDTRADIRSSSFARSIGLRSLLVAPIRSRNRNLGAITLHCMETFAFTDEDARLLTILATQAGLAIENAQLFDSQRRARLVAELQRERMRVLADRIVTAQEEERLRISRELHDEAGQALTSLKISLDLIRSGLPPGLDALRDRLADLAELTGGTMEALRNLAHDLRPPGLDTFGLNVALEGLCHDFANRVNKAISYQGEEIPKLPMTVALSMYRFAQEALTNIGKHAEAENVKVHLTLLDKAVELRIVDDGRGFTYDPDFRNASGIGLVSMQERIDLVGGTLEIITSPGRGVQLTARVPR